VAALATKLRNAPRLVLLPAITAVWRDTYRVTARWRRSPRRATSVTRPATSRVIAPRTNLAVEEDQRVAMVVVADRRTLSATSAAKSATLRSLAPRPVAEGEDTAAEEVVVVATLVARAATHAVESAISLVIAFKALNATIAVERATSPRTARNLSDGHAIPADLKAISLGTALAQLPKCAFWRRAARCFGFPNFFLPLNESFSTACSGLSILSTHIVV